MTNGALKRNLNTNPINVLIAQRLDAPMVTFAKSYFADNAQTTLGTGMTGTLLSKSIGVIYDGRENAANGNWVAASEPRVAQSLLESNTEYVIYGMENESTIVNELLVFETDTPAPVPTQASDSVFNMVDTTLEKDHIEITLNADEFYIFPVQSYSLFVSSIINMTFSYSGESGTDVIIQIANRSFFGTPDDGYTNQLYLFRSYSTDEEMFNKGAYILMDTSRMFLDKISINNPIYFGKYWRRRGTLETLDRIQFSHLKIQKQIR